MGLYDREYYRDDEGDGNSWLNGRAVIGIICFTGFIYFLQLLTTSRSGTDELLAFGGFDLQKIYNGEVWRLIFAPFLHNPQNLVYVVLNMVILYLFANPLETIFGSKEFLGFYLAAAFVAQLGEFAAQATGIMPAWGPYGSAGAVAAIITVYVLRFPQTQLPLVQLPFWPLWVIILGLSALSLALKRPIIFSTNPALNLVGAAFGLAYHRYGWNITSWIPTRDSFRRSTARRPKLRVLPLENPTELDETPEPVTATAQAKRSQGNVDEQLEAKLDHVLEKVARLGKQSLTAEENEILLRASEIYKRRRGN